MKNERTFNLVSGGKGNESEIKRFNEYLKQKPRRYLVIRINPTGQMIIEKSWKIIVVLGGSLITGLITGLIL